MNRGCVSDILQLAELLSKCRRLADRINTGNHRDNVTDAEFFETCKHVNVTEQHVQDVEYWLGYVGSKRGEAAKHDG